MKDVNTFKKNTYEAETIVKGYLYQSKSFYYSLAFVIPLAILYEISSLIANRSLLGGIRSAAEVWILNILWGLGFPAYIPLSLVFIAIFSIMFIINHRSGRALRWHYLLPMFVESLLLGFIIGVFASFLMRILPMSLGVLNNISVSFGAGLYEELIFRVLIFTSITWLLIKSGLKKIFGYTIAITLSSFIFSLAHHIGPMGEPLTFYAFVYRFFSGCILCGLYISRGFGITAWAHSLYDLMVVCNFYNIIGCGG